MDVSITKQALKRLEEQSKLSSNAVARFRRKIYQIVSGQVCAGQIAKMHGHQCIFRIRFNISLRIIATVVKTEQGTQFRILDFVTHDQMDGDQYVTKTNNPIDVQDFDYEFNNDPEISDYDNFICSNEKLQIDESGFEADRDDFYLRTIPDPKNLKNPKDPEIWLSSEQNELVKKQLPILLSGSAGSGKTTILIYHALEKSFEAPINKVLYVTYNKFLKKEAERIAGKICSNVPPKLEFCSYLDLLRSSYVDTNQFNEAQEVNQQRFMNEFYRTRSNSKDFRGVDPILVWQEIRNLIKGSVFAIEENKKLLTFDEYQTKKNESSLTDWSLFRQVYSLAEKYKVWIESKNYWDEIDITQNALFNISNSLTEEGKYTAIYCDEIQDLTKNQIGLLLKILQKSHYKLPDFFFTGDPAQIINPSGFSWNKVKDLIYNLCNNSPKSQSIQKDELKLNFRSTEGIVNLGRKILESNDVNTHELLFQEAYRKGGEMPLAVNIAEPDILRDNDDFGSRNAIIVASEKEKSKLKKQFSKDGIGSERIFLFTEVKGLEFDEVLVWKFFEYFNSWGTNSQDLERFKYNLLYVCTTRAREKLYFYEGENVNIFWENIAIKPCISITNDYQEIDNFFKKYETIIEILEAAQDRERIGKYKLAKELYRKCNYQNDAIRMDALIYEEAKQFNEAAKYWEMAAVGYENDSKWSDAESCWRKLSKWEKVALACENQEKWIDAAKTYEELSNFENAARCYANRKDWSDAERCWRNLSNWEKVAVACENQGKWLDAAIAYEKISDSDFENAARCYTHLENWAEVERCWRNLSNWEKVAVACENQGKWLDAAQEWEKAQNWQKVGDIYKRQERWDDALNLFRDHEMWSDLEKILKEIYTKLRWKITPEQGKQLAIALDNQKKYRDAIYWTLDKVEVKNG